MKKFLPLLVFVLACTSSYQQPVIKYQKTAGGNKNDDFRAMCVTKDGGSIIGGYSLSGISGEKTDSSRTNWDYWVVKFDSAGNITWDKTIGGNDADWFQEIIQTKDGGYLLAGYSYSGISGEKTDSNRGTLTYSTGDYWIVKLDSTGNIQWDKTIGGNKEDELSSILQTNDGGFLLGGHSYSDKSGEKTGYNRGGSDFWIVKVDASGNKQWDKTIGGNQDDQLTSMQQTADGGIILAGGSISDISGEKTEANRNNSEPNHYYDYWVVKLNKYGAIEWDKTVGGSSTDALSCIRVTKDGGYLLGGYSNSPVSFEKTEMNRGHEFTTDYWLVKLDNAGNLKWDKTIGGNDDDVLTDFDNTTDGGYVLGGFSLSGVSGEKTEANKGSAFTYDYWVVKIDSIADIEWDKTIGGNKTDALFKIQELKKNIYLLGGYSNSAASGDKSSKPRGGDDYWMVILNYKPANAIINSYSNHNLSLENLHTEFTVYPNPVKNKLHVQTKGSANFTLTDQSGKMLLTKSVTGKDEIDVSSIAAGSYYLTNTVTNQSRKIIITR